MYDMIGKDRDFKWIDAFDLIIVGGNKPAFLIDDKWVYVCYDSSNDDDDDDDDDNNDDDEEEEEVILMILWIQIMTTTILMILM